MSDYIELFQSPNKVVKDVVPQCDYSTPMEEWPLLLIQVTKFSCGGLCLCICTSHVLVDGWSIFLFNKLWAKLGRGEDLNKDEIPIHDRSILKLSHPQQHTIGDQYDHSGFKAPPFLLGCSDSKEQQKKETSLAFLRVTKEQIDSLKKEANALQGGNNHHSRQPRPYSRYEVVAAHMWRCACKARQDNKNQPTVIRLVADIRNRLKPTIPLNFTGNVVLPVLTPACRFGDILSNPLSFAAQKIREATETLTDEHVRAALDYAENLQNVDSLRYGNREGFYYGNPNLAIGSMIGIPLYDVDFGWGKPVYYDPGNMGIQDGKSLIIPSPDGDGSLFIHVRLQTQHMEAFKKYFYDHKDSIGLDIAQIRNGPSQSYKARL
ncbi:spermidine hydroxycinnamoyl transferase-like [Quillaja saponaria]|uniref:Spermidine hydroxycinnamoyl transferase-like n=1 Tax=Quillaja saponaria TaxID=32244 RepID=A0AAD7KML7_QUISA|nr:spermidine hydroxycinnamoyl transferase-like [Quillaja saponaria]KAJ7943912.1 spermidine hydroxycinnamoyl transferase-like [Quillaja saponaria]